MALLPARYGPFYSHHLLRLPPHLPTSQMSKASPPLPQVRLGPSVRVSLSPLFQPTAQFPHAPGSQMSHHGTYRHWCSGSPAVVDTIAMLPTHVEELWTAAVIGRVVIQVRVPEQLLKLSVQLAVLFDRQNVVVVFFPWQWQFALFRLASLAGHLGKHCARYRSPRIIARQALHWSTGRLGWLGLLCFLQVPPVLLIHVQQPMVTTPAFVLLLTQNIVDHVSQPALLALDLALAEAQAQLAQVVFSHQVESCRQQHL
jgi:hypothetical protein